MQDSLPRGGETSVEKDSTELTALKHRFPEAPHRLETRVPNLANRDNLVNPASDDLHGEGQALALREGAAFFSP